MMSFGSLIPLKVEHLIPDWIFSLISSFFWKLLWGLLLWTSLKKKKKADFWHINTDIKSKEGYIQGVVCYVHWKTASKYSQKSRLYVHELKRRRLFKKENNLKRKKRIRICKKINSDNSIINNPIKEEKKGDKEISVAIPGVIWECTNDGRGTFQRKKIKKYSDQKIH